MAEFTVDSIFERILKREMEILIAEKQKSCQMGATNDLATDRLVEAYFLKTQYEDRKHAYESENRFRKTVEEERDRYRESARKLRGE